MNWRLSVKCMEFRYLVTAPELNSHGTLHGGVLMRWIDEAAGMHARKLTNRVCVTRFMENVSFISKAKLGDILLITTELTDVGTSSLAFNVIAYEDISARQIAVVKKIVFVSIDHQGNKVAHGIDNEKG